ncbi:hypothetical protein B0A80_15955 [Flavobacterium tructae]|uniref:hypothetical protein n=1 Tax=Flavobacterium tructae TaxID=1114873 RepID=UPI000B5BCA84|nr:hypothetical protein [Flavobacterium tructae]OXB21836.1 hypothetical protein B0A80_15955 [Flavobacterium tructae]
MIKLIPSRFRIYCYSASCFLVFTGCKTIDQDVIQHNFIVGERNKGDLFYNNLLDVSIEIPKGVVYDDLSKIKKSALQKRIGNSKDVTAAHLFLRYKTDQNLETFYFFEKIEKPSDTIVHEKLLQNDSINGIIVYEKIKGSKKIVALTRMSANTNHLEKATESMRKVHLDSTSLNKLSYMQLFNYYTTEPHKNYLQGREKIKKAPIKDPKKIMLKDPLYLTINSYIGDNREYDALIKGYESDKSDFNRTVLNSLSQNEVKKEEAVIAAIGDLANDNQMIILNEDHFYPKHRLFAMNLLDVLKQKGFTVISMETYTPNYNTNTAPVPNAKNGFYIKDPYFGHFVRKANAMGFTLVGHENSDQKIDREIGQAKNVMNILEKDPKAKIFIYVGHGHLEEEGKKRLMANYLKEYSNIDPVTINQETVMMKIKEKLVLLPKSVFAKDTLMKSSADYFLINNLEANLQSVYPNQVFKKVSLKDQKFIPLKNQELLVDVFLLDEYNTTKNADLLIPIQSTLITPKSDTIETNLPVGQYYITVKSANNDLFSFNRIEVN